LTAAFNIRQWRASSRQEWELVDDGNGVKARKAELRTRHGVVEVFSYPGNGPTPAFTSFDMYIYPNVFHARLPRCYHDRWLPRLAWRFDWACHELSENGGRP
jgi:hypothetical protein